MKTLLILLVSILFALNCSSQRIYSVNRELTINTTAFFRQFASFNSGGAALRFNPFFINYNVFSKCDGFRLSAGVSGLNGDLTNDQVSTKHLFLFDVRVSYLVRVYDSKIFSMNLNFDRFFRRVIINDGSFMSANGELIRAGQKGSGRGYSLDFIFHLTDRISLSTETGLAWVKGSNYNSGIRLIQFKRNNGFFQQKPESTIQLALPTSIYFGILFHSKTKLKYKQ